MYGRYGRGGDGSPPVVRRCGLPVRIGACVHTWLQRRARALQTRGSEGDSAGCLLRARHSSNARVAQQQRTRMRTRPCNGGADGGEPHAHSHARAQRTRRSNSSSSSSRAAALCRRAPGPAPGALALTPWPSSTVSSCAFAEALHGTSTSKLSRASSCGARPRTSGSTSVLPPVCPRCPWRACADPGGRGCACAVPEASYICQHSSALTP